MNRRVKTMKKGLSLVIILGFILLSFFRLVSANSEVALQKWGEELNQNDKDILDINSDKYEARVLEEFAKLRYSEANQTNITESNDVKYNKSFVPIIIELKDFSKANDLLSNFSKDDIQDVAIRNLSNIIGLDLTEEAFFKLIQDDRVKTVYYDRPMYLSLNESVPLINANDAWASGYTGEGVKICVIDTGVDTNHPDLEYRIADQKCYCRGGGVYPWD